MSLTLAPKSVHRPKDGIGKVINNGGTHSCLPNAFSCYRNTATTIECGHKPFGSAI